MAVENLYGSKIITGLIGTNGIRSLAAPGLAGGRMRIWCETVEFTAAATVASTYHMARLPSNARIFGLSKIYFDDLASTGSPVVNIGCFNPTGQTGLTDLATSLRSSLDVYTAAASYALIADIANYGKRLWELHGASVDPQQEIDIKLTLATADVNTGGTATLELVYSLD